VFQDSALKTRAQKILVLPCKHGKSHILWQSKLTTHSTLLQGDKNSII